MPELDAHVLRDAGAGARSESKLFFEFFSRRANELSKANIQKYKTADQGAGGILIGKLAFREAVMEVAGISAEELDAILGPLDIGQLQPAASAEALPAGSEG